ncbi:2-oxo-4-hydroxy-4-carboxy-5-ureidoimidazoline decarboxylase [Cellulomonas sp. S1-8]|uniref:2-oxo-4-hydroxy-4-carboxy-5-ureidoimidazoline decarboxylase n=1 Tax=Cellulomonas sp. S1-8 TaxID=2904790 RepID=UPI0022432CCC|nr:2-oxo-4-hydroxy-4-carboxy-5-ureidoimidazoline decarboxylase [Cellulomonas sp. S1-8]UZN02446.1 2-oxo-4-hydroxy-4-carboxy-5-ureidoimidazoline decarboxylase [Cellulomonas sp. S1-8]
MLLEDFNALPREDAWALVRTCADVPSWAAAVAGGRPYASVAALRAHADQQALTWDDADVDRALADHPRIGERHATPGATAAMSVREQAGVDATDADVAARLADGNARYEQRFGRVYLVRAAGRSSAEILALLEQRLTHDDATEAAVTAQQLREIAALRLAGLVTEPVVQPVVQPVAQSGSEHATAPVA